MAVRLNRRPLNCGKPGHPAVSGRGEPEHRARGVVCRALGRGAGSWPPRLGTGRSGPRVGRIGRGRWRTPGVPGPHLGGLPVLELGNTAEGRGGGISALAGSARVPRSDRRSRRHVGPLWTPPVGLYLGDRRRGGHGRHVDPLGPAVGAPAAIKVLPVAWVSGADRSPALFTPRLASQIARVATASFLPQVRGDHKTSEVRQLAVCAVLLAPRSMLDLEPALVAQLFLGTPNRALRARRVLANGPRLGKDVLAFPRRDLPFGGVLPSSLRRETAPLHLLMGRPKGNVPGHPAAFGSLGQPAAGIAAGVAWLPPGPRRSGQGSHSAMGTTNYRSDGHAASFGPEPIGRPSTRRDVLARAAPMDTTTAPARPLWRSDLGGSWRTAAGRRPRSQVRRSTVWREIFFICVGCLSGTGTTRTVGRKTLGAGRFASRGRLPPPARADPGTGRAPRAGSPIA